MGRLLALVPAAAARSLEGARAPNLRQPELALAGAYVGGSALAVGLGAGVLVATTSPGVVFALAAGAFLWVALMIASIRVEGRIQLGGEPARDGLLAGFRALADNREARTIAVLFCAQTFVRGLLSVLVV